MPVLLLSKKSITRSLSKKWDSVRGNNNSNYKTRSSSSPSTDKDEDEVAVVSDTSLDDSDSSGGDEENAAEKYGYGDAVPDTETKSFPRRLSTRNSIRRRSSICRQKSLSFSEDQHDDDKNVPFHPTRAPRRRFSIKGPTRARAAARRRRASIATCTVNTASSSSIEKPSTQVLEIRVPRRRDSIQRRTSITFHENVNNVRKIQAISQVKGASVKQELGCQDSEDTTHIKKKICALIDKVDATSGHYDGNKYGTHGLEHYTSHNHEWSLIEEEERSPSGPETSTIQYDHDHNNHEDNTHKLYYSVYDDDDAIMMGEDGDNEYYEYEANNEDYDEDDDTMTMIEYNMTYTEADDDARFCQVTTNADTRTRSRPMNKVGKYRQ